jgi:hypothetical protein
MEQSNPIPTRVVNATWHPAAAATIAPNKHPAGNSSNHCQDR